MEFQFHSFSSRIFYVEAMEGSSSMQTYNIRGRVSRGSRSHVVLCGLQLMAHGDYLYAFLLLKTG